MCIECFIFIDNIYSNYWIFYTFKYAIVLMSLAGLIDSQAITSYVLSTMTNIKSQFLPYMLLLATKTVLQSSYMQNTCALISMLWKICKHFCCTFSAVLINKQLISAPIFAFLSFLTLVPLPTSFRKPFKSYFSIISGKLHQETHSD